MSSPSERTSKDLPAVDERLVAPESGYEIDDGQLVYVPPSDEPHGVGHCALGVLLFAHRNPDRSVAIDMLTRTTVTSDQAPDASVYPTERDPATGGRQIEELAFEIIATEKLGHAALRAATFVGRGVRRVFAIDVVRRRAFEWSRELASWSFLAPESSIEDPALAVPLRVSALVDAAEADDAAVRAYRAKRHPEFLAERAEGREEGRAEGRESGRYQGRLEGRLEERAEMLRKLVVLRFGPLDSGSEAIIARATGDELEHYFERAVAATSLAAIFTSRS